MLSTVKRLGMVLGLLACVVFNSGCFFLVGAAAGAGGYAWVKGELKQEFDKPKRSVHTATRKALKSLEIEVVSDDTDAFVTIIQGDMVGTNLKVRIEHIARNKTTLSVRVGMLGDQKKSQEIMEKIKSYL